MVAAAVNKADIIQDWQWLEEHLVPTLFAFDSEDDITDFVRCKIESMVAQLKHQLTAANNELLGIEVNHASNVRHNSGGPSSSIWYVASGSDSMGDGIDTDVELAEAYAASQQLKSMSADDSSDSFNFKVQSARYSKLFTVSDDDKLVNCKLVHLDYC